jgi:hypothetical protein
VLEEARWRSASSSDGADAGAGGGRAATVSRRCLVAAAGAFMGEFTRLTPCTPHTGHPCQGLPLASTTHLKALHRCRHLKHCFWLARTTFLVRLFLQGMHSMFWVCPDSVQNLGKQKATLVQGNAADLGHEPARHVETAVQDRADIGGGRQRLEQGQDGLRQHSVIHIAPVQSSHAERVGQALTLTYSLHQH